MTSGQGDTIITLLTQIQNIFETAAWASEVCAFALIGILVFAAAKTVLR